MKKRSILLVIAITFFIAGPNAIAFEVGTHQAINDRVARDTYTLELDGFSFSLDMYLKNSLGLPKGIAEEFITSSKESHDVAKWLSLGGLYEDKPAWYEPYIRSVNHFHNPLTDRGFTGIWNLPILLSGQSSRAWALLAPQTQSPGGFYSWNDVRGYYFKL